MGCRSERREESAFSPKSAEILHGVQTDVLSFYRIPKYAVYNTKEVQPHLELVVLLRL
jgi:Rps23 Pro-64 3,4-dihydroxylase Tpa1-like proline 4-hydroxylase